MQKREPFAIPADYGEASKLAFSHVSDVRCGGIRRLKPAAITPESIQEPLVKETVKACWEQVTSQNGLQQTLTIKQLPLTEISYVQTLWRKSAPGQPANPLRDRFDQFFDQQLEAFELTKHINSWKHLRECTRGKALEWANLLNAESVKFLIQDIRAMGYEEGDAHRMMVGACANVVKAFEQAGLLHSTYPIHNGMADKSPAGVMRAIGEMETAIQRQHARGA